MHRLRHLSRRLPEEVHYYVNQKTSSKGKPRQGVSPFLSSTNREEAKPHISMHPHPPPTRTSPLPKSGEERLVYRLAALTRMVEPPGQKSAFLWRLDTVSLGKHQRNGVERQQELQSTSQRIGAHAESAMTRPPCLSLCTCALFYWAIDRAGPARSTPFLCSCAKKRGGAPKKRAYGCRHGSCWVPPASPTDSKPQHHRRLRQADLSARSTPQAPPQVGRR